MVIFPYGALLLGYEPHDLRYKWLANPNQSHNHFPHIF